MIRVGTAGWKYKDWDGVVYPKPKPRGFDKQTEHDMAQPGDFASNYELVNAQQAREMVEDTISFERFAPPTLAVDASENWRA